MKPIFRSAMFGFNKADVVAFVAKQSKQYENRIAELEEELERQNREHTAEMDRFKSDRDALDSLRARSLQSADTAKRIEVLSESILSRFDSLEQCSELCGNDRIQLRDGILTLQTALKDALSFREKAEKFDRLAGVLSSIVSGREENLTVSSQSSVDPTVSIPSEQNFDRQDELLKELFDSLRELCGLLKELDLLQ